MKLDNRGWSFNFFIVVGTLFLLILIVVSIRIRSMTHQFKEDNKEDSNKSSEKSTINKTDDNVYVLLEQTLKKAGDSYAALNSSMVDDIDDHIIVSYETLKSNGFIESLADPNGSGDCDGYVFIKSDYSVQPFIKCSNYETLNYSLWVD